MARFGGARAQRVPLVASRLRDQPTGDGQYCSRWSKTYTGCGWAKTFLSCTASLAGSSPAGGPRAGLIRGGPSGSPMSTGHGRGLFPTCHPLGGGRFAARSGRPRSIRSTSANGGQRPSTGRPAPGLREGAVTDSVQTLVLVRPRSAVAWAADTGRGHGLRRLSPGISVPGTFPPTWALVGHR